MHNLSISSNARSRFTASPLKYLAALAGLAMILPIVLVVGVGFSAGVLVAVPLWFLVRLIRRWHHV